MGRAIWIAPTKHSALFRKILLAYTTGATISIDGGTYSEGDTEHLLQTWCTNRQIRRTRDFALCQGGRLIFSFHDSSDHVWAAYSELSFVQSLRARKIARFTVLLPEPDRRTSFLGRILDKLAELTTRPRP